MTLGGHGKRGPAMALEARGSLRSARRRFG